MSGSFNTIRKARQLAAEAHEGQKYGSRPYIVHLFQVVKILNSFDEIDLDVLAAAWLHDSIEDTDITVNQIRSQIGDRVADLVDAVTDGTGKNRKEKKERPYRLIPLVPGAIRLKLADRLANVLACKQDKNLGLLHMYRREHRVFYDRLYPAAKGDLIAIGMFGHLCTIIGGDKK